MNSPRINDKEILAYIDREISGGRLNRVCQAEAERASHGNDELMQALYILKRLEMLKRDGFTRRGVRNDSPPKDERITRKKDTAKLVRYQSDTGAASSRFKKEGARRLVSSFLGNFILLLSSVSAITAFMVLQGDTVYDLSYWLIFGLAIGFMVLPYLISGLSSSRRGVPYQTSLKVTCIIMCICSVTSGIFVMQQNPQNYVVEQMGSELDPQLRGGGDMRVNLGGAKSNESMVSQW